MRYKTELRKVVARLERSSGRRIARRNARREMDTLLKRMRAVFMNEYPSIGKDGEEIRREMLPKGVRRCPADGAYVPTAGELAAHVVMKHGAKCWCGFTPDFVKALGVDMAGAMMTKRPQAASRAASSLRAHFNRFKDQLSAHLTIGALGENEGDDSDE